MRMSVWLKLKWESFYQDTLFGNVSSIQGSNMVLK